MSRYNEDRKVQFIRELNELKEILPQFIDKIMAASTDKVNDDFYMIEMTDIEKAIYKIQWFMKPK